MICCYGDSNTYGYDPRSPLGERYARCWCDLLPGYEARNLGMNGRTVSAVSPQLENALGQDTELLIVMLGTNDILQGDEPPQVAGRMEMLLKAAILQHPGIPVLLLAPPDIGIPEFKEKIRQLAALYEKLANKLGLYFLDPQCWALSMACDGVHLSEMGHTQLGRHITDFLKSRHI